MIILYCKIDIDSHLSG